MSGHTGWHGANNLAGYAQRSYGVKVGHVIQRWADEWVGLYDGNVIGIGSSEQEAQAMVDQVAGR